jgi:two-component system cell cycle sensor histidine kinase/response regulator CckA
MTARLRALFVGDSENDALLLAQGLRRGGFDLTHERIYAPEGLSEAVRSQRWDIVFADYSLSRFHALDVLTLLQELDLDLPCIIVTGTVDEQEAVSLLRAGAHDYIMKGNMTRLIPAVERELRDAARRREHKKTQEALRQAEEKYHSIFENALEGLIQTTSSGRIITANPSMANMLGYGSPEELIVQVTDIDDQLHSGAEPGRRLRDMLEQRDVVQGYEMQLLRKDGSRIWVLASVMGFRDRSGALLYYDWTVENITERKRLEQQLVQSQKMEAVGRLAGGVAHDFNNLLTAIIGYSQLMMARIEDERMRRELEEIMKAGERAAALTRQLLAFSRKQVLQPQIVNVNEIVSGACAMLDRLIGEDVELIAVPDPDIGRIRADPGQIEQVLMNLVVNARDAMPSGGTLAIRTSNLCVTEHGSHEHIGLRPGDYVMIEVVDTGFGMDNETISHIFEPFFTTKEPGRGTGLGLSTVYGIVKQSGGSILVNSQPGSGTTFRIYLPRADETAFPPKAPVRVPSLASGTETILLVEDEPSVRALASEVLQLSGYTLLESSSASEAIRIAEAFPDPIHLMVTDVVMPRMSGRELARRLGTILPDTRVLFMSGYTEDAIVNHGVIESGAGFLQKPFTPSELARKVREILDTSG